MCCTCSFSFTLKTFLLALLTGLVTTRVSVSEKPLSTLEHLSKKDDSPSGTHKEQPYTEEEITPQEGGTTGDQHTASISGSELHRDVKWETSIVMQKTSERGALLSTYLTILCFHVTSSFSKTKNYEFFCSSSFIR